MLILSRRAGEAILIDGRIRVVLVEAGRHGVRIGIDAPPEVSIVREEIAQRIAEENRRAGASAEARDWLEMLPLPGEP